MENAKLLSIYFLLGRSPKDWDFMEDDWVDEYQELTDLSWDEFLVLHDLGAWKFHEQAQSLFDELFSKFPGFQDIEEVFNSISADSEDWNDFFEILLDSEDFEDMWNISWLTRDNMESSLNEFIEANQDSEVKILAFRNFLEQWFNSGQVETFKLRLIDLLKPLEEAVNNLD
jgi:hypothetical protein